MMIVASNLAVAATAGDDWRQRLAAIGDEVVAVCLLLLFLAFIVLMLAWPLFQDQRRKRHSQTSRRWQR
jgi:hypothetical protein